MRTAPFTGVAGATALVALFAMHGAALAQESFSTDRHEVQVQRIAQGLEHPWAIALLPDGRFLVTERNPGNLRLGSLDGQLSEPLDGVPEVFRPKGETGRSQAGLFDVKLHPQFAENQLVYLSLSTPTERGASVTVVRGRLAMEGQQPRLEDVETVFDMKEDDQDSSALHFGGRMAFHPENGELFLSIGERRNISRSQDAEDQAGSILRIGADGGAAGDSPFDNGDEYVYAIGIRNIQALAFRPGTDELWAVDHGPLGGDNIQLIEGGKNYGWPYLTSGRDYSGAPMGEGIEREGMERAKHHFQETLGPSGLAFYEGAMFPEWQGHMLIGAMAGRALVRMELNGQDIAQEGDGEWMLQDLDRRIRDVQVAADGSIWLVTDHEDGEVIRLTSGEAPVAGTERP